MGTISFGTITAGYLPLEEGIFACRQSFTAAQALSMSPVTPYAAVDSCLAAVTDNGGSQTILAAGGIVQPPVPRQITGTTGGVGADIKAIQATVVGTDVLDAALTEVLPVFTVNTPTTVTSINAFKTITSITIPAHDGTGATTSFGFGAELLHNAVADTAATQTITTGIRALPSPRCVTAIVSGTAGNVTAVSCNITGTDVRDQVISEVLPAFTVSTLGTVTSTKAFKTVTSISQPAIGTATKVSYGITETIGLANYMPYNTVVSCALNGTKESTAATVTASTTYLSKNTIDLFSALSNTPVQVIYYAHQDQTYVG